MAVLAVSLLVAGVSGTMTRPYRLPAWVFPLAAAALAVSFGVVRLPAAWDAVEPLVEPILFLLLAVPLAVLLDQLGVFSAVAALTAGRHLAVAMWITCAVAVAVLNLDAAVVLCTPLAITTARRWGMDPVAMAFQPALLACLASSALPVSNLTNLIAVSQDRVTTMELITHLGPPTVAACVVGYFGWRIAFRHRQLRPVVAVTTEAPSRRALVTGAAVLTVLLVGFLLGPAAGVPAWMVVAIVDLALIAMARRVPWRAVPWGTAGVAAGLAIVATAAAEHVGLSEWLTAPEVWRQALYGAGSANVLNNLPAFLLALPHTVSQPQLFALLLGVNVGPTILVTGSLAGLLWLESVRRLGLGVGAKEYARVGLTAGVPALLVSIAVLTGIT